MNVDVVDVALPPVGGAVEARDDPSSDDDSQANANVLENEHFLENGEEDSSSDEEPHDVCNCPPRGFGLQFGCATFDGGQ